MAEYFSTEELVKKESSEDPIYKGYKAVLDSKSTDETLVHPLSLHVDIHVTHISYLSFSDVLFIFHFIFHSHFIIKLLHSNLLTTYDLMWN